ncbi:intradiol ring-cleavage dioxygenase [Nocardioides iriomotensis]|uniref:3,4-dioxygenase subunit beta n=1 Tax=Nocardioides iriomotensis TaxID=715784 RepID=A0A4Q5IYS0_9ACTN|nr:intradiol ring-cleavage dioxygenase [Nocardioides iriomotensis]RYU10169.1 3,4-dioxygenase subunit beta [Nocardioides iriomotensis]
MTDPRWLDADGRPLDEEDRGLVYDVRTLVARRRVLGLFGGVGAAALLAACGSDDSSATPSSSSTPTATTDSGASGGDLTEVPDETGGPYPGDGSNGVDVLDDSGIVRSDIRSSFGSSTTTAEGVPLTIRLTVRDAATGRALSGAAVYLWHCTADGSYSLYSPGVENENFLRGVQETDSSGTVQFTSVFPGCYSGRWPHIHFEVYGGVDDAVSSGPIVKTSQIALPQEACEAVYATGGYEASVPNLAGTSLTQDMVFGDDGGIHQLASMSGDADDGYVAALTIGV